VGTGATVHVEASNGDGEDSLTDRKTCRSFNCFQKIKKKKKKKPAAPSIVSKNNRCLHPQATAPCGPRLLSRRIRNLTPKRCVILCVLGLSESRNVQQTRCATRTPVGTVDPLVEQWMAFRESPGHDAKAAHKLMMWGQESSNCCCTVHVRLYIKCN
jgi:hypothetical protein